MSALPAGIVFSILMSIVIKPKLDRFWPKPHFSLMWWWALGLKRQPDFYLSNGLVSFVL